MLVNILGADYDVVETECVSKDEMKLGEISIIKQEIRIDSSMRVDAKRTALLHEVIHGILFACGLDWQNENLIQSLATGMYQVLRENEDLLSFLGLLRKSTSGGGLRSLASTTIPQDL